LADEEFEFDIDWGPGLAQKIRKKDPKGEVFDHKKIKNLQYKFKLTAKDAKKTEGWTKRDRDGFEKLLRTYSARVIVKTNSGVETALDNFFKNNITTLPDGSLAFNKRFKKKADKDKAVQDLVAILEAMVKNGSDDITNYAQKSLKQYFKGQVRQDVLTRQAVKHVVRPVATPAIGAVGLAFTSTGFLAPLGILLLKSAWADCKASWDFLITKKYRSTARLKDSMDNVRKYLADSEKKLDAARAQGDAKEAKRLEVKAKNKEGVAHMKQEFLVVRTKSVEKLDYICKKYQKKLYEKKFEVANSENVTGALADRIVELKRKIAKDKKQAKALVRSGNAVGNKQVKAMVQLIDANVDNAQSEILKLEGKIRDAQDWFDKARVRLVNEEGAFEGIKADLARFKAARDDDIHAFKKLVKGINFGTSALGAAMGTGDQAATELSKTAAHVASSIGNTVGYLEMVKDGYDELKQKLSG